jgi:hypothetical protein
MHTEGGVVLLLFDRVIADEAVIVNGLPSLLEDLLDYLGVRAYKVGVHRNRYFVLPDEDVGDLRS